MPFILKERRAMIANGTLKSTDFEAGDRCYVYYKDMVEAWRKSPRWTTADKIYQNVLTHSFTVEDQAAAQLAWQVFFQLYVMPYELLKRKENGDI